VVEGVVNPDNQQRKVVNSMKRYYAAYGSNLNIPQMLRRCPSARIIGTSEIPDYRLMYKGSKSGAYLTIEKAEGHSVPVGVWEVDGEDELTLDRYEGYPSFYYKAELKLPIRGIYSGKIRIRRLFVYIMREDRELALPSPYYVRVCREGYKAFNFDKTILDEALEYTMKSVADERGMADEG